MVGIVVASHGQLCEGILNSVSMVAGELEQTKTVSLVPGMTPDTYAQMMRDAIGEMDTGDGVVVLIDLLGGTPFNTIGSLAREYNVQIVTGMNMAAVITLALERSEDTTLDELAKLAETAAHDGIKLLNPNS
ncbi:MAG: PTS sugar transporter subunit IIA [Anaerostipes sp.]|nr:PTS sugar transporter subunit IIA [Anaerostipes sp.]